MDVLPLETEVGDLLVAPPPAPGKEKTKTKTKLSLKLANPLSPQISG